MMHDLRDIFRFLRGWLTDPSPAGMLIHLVIWAVIVAAAFTFVAPARCETPAGSSVDCAGFCASTEADAIAMIRHWVRVAPRHPMARPARQQRFAALQVAATLEHGTPLSLTMAIMFRESSGRPSARGTAGEIGLMQVHPQTWARYCRGLDRDDPRDQLHCGHRVLRANFDKCGNWTGAFTRYASRYGVCQARPGGKLARVVKDRLRFAGELERVAR